MCVCVCVGVCKLSVFCVVCCVCVCKKHLIDISVYLRATHPTQRTRISDAGRDVSVCVHTRRLRKSPIDSLLIIYISQSYYYSLLNDG